MAVALAILAIVVAAVLVSSRAAAAGPVAVGGTGPILGPWSFVTTTALATLVSEDLTCIGVGLLVAAGQASLPVGLAGCILGIFLGDVGLWAIGRVAGRRVVGWRWLKDRLPGERLEEMGRWLDEHCGPVVLASRFLPGTRVPLYIAAGVLGRRPVRFFLWLFVAALLWVPLLVGSVALFGENVAVPLARWLGASGVAIGAGLLVAYGGLRLAVRLADPIARARLASGLARLWRWEFWPAWLLYLPLLPYLLWLSLRYRSLTVWTAANPAIPAGGVVGESKHDILVQLPPEWVVPFALLPPGPVADRLALVRQALEAHGWAFPLILKPDASQRGAGVKRVWDFVEVEKYLLAQPAAVLAQPYHPGPCEAGIFYYRLPGEAAGCIFSLTDKHFPVVTGDGRSTLAQLVWAHRRYRMQADVFLARHAAEAGRILAAGETFPLALAGNHCQGTMFRDGAHLVTPELERTVDAIARGFDGFFVGRFDVRYADVDAFRAGRDLAIVELNGVTSESTNIYDPDNTLWGAYRTLFRQWELLYRIGELNRRRGHRPVALGMLVRDVVRYYRTRRIDPLAD
jgi:membrane protein DedA with SNARE-associated domain